jgi:pimeloyl-ACP methyl ester carboxylesterase
MYQPTRYPPGSLDNVARGHGLQPWTNPKGQRIGWRRAARDGTSAGDVLIVHGNAGSALDRIDFVEGLQGAAPFNVCILEYPGYGERQGKASQQDILQAAAEGLELLTNGGPLFVLGESLGTGVAAWLAGTYADAVSGVMLFCPFNNMTAVAQHHMSIFPVRLMLRDRYPSQEWLSNYRGPVGVVVVTDDVVVPARFGHRLYSSYSGPKKLWEFADCGHNDVCLRPAKWWSELAAFWGEHTRR